MISFHKIGKPAVALGAQHDWGPRGTAQPEARTLMTGLGGDSGEVAYLLAPEASDASWSMKWPPCWVMNFCTERLGPLEDIKDSFQFWCSITAHFGRGSYGRGGRWKLEGKGRGSQDDLVSNACSFILHLQKKSPTPLPHSPKNSLFLQTFKN